MYFNPTIFYRQELSQMERNKYIAKSESLNKQLEDTRYSIEELRKQLSQQETEESLEDKIVEVRSLSRYYLCFKL